MLFLNQIFLIHIVIKYDKYDFEMTSFNHGGIRMSNPSECSASQRPILKLLSHGKITSEFSIILVFSFVFLRFLNK